MQQIGNFMSMYLALYRPIKKTYYLLQWRPANQHWVLCADLVEPRPAVIEKCRSGHHPDGGTVNIKMWTDSLMNVVCDSSYLKYGDFNIPIGKRTGGYNVASGLLLQREFTATGLGPVNNLVLWTVPTAPLAAAPLAVAQPKPMPTRIAWLIADDASRNNEICSITMDPISPLTASVTTCFHCYDSAAINAWLLNKSECPQCRAACVATRAFVEN